jgi:Rad3-related DNA helicase
VKVVSYEVPFKAKVLITPMYNMSKTRIDSPEKMRKIFRNVAFYMKSVAKVVERLLGTSIKVVVHCASFEYATEISQHFKDAIVHTGEDKLENVIRAFNENIEKGWLFVVSAEYGGDFKGVPLQFVLKVPYPALDERIIAMREKVGEAKFRAWYEWTALSKLVQACGRNAREPNYPALTIVIDRSCLYLLRKYHAHCPSWFKNRLVVVEQPRKLRTNQYNA